MTSYLLNKQSTRLIWLVLIIQLESTLFLKSFLLADTNKCLILFERASRSTRFKSNSNTTICATTLWIPKLQVMPRHYCWRYPTLSITYIFVIATQCWGTSKLSHPIATIKNEFLLFETRLDITYHCNERHSKNWQANSVVVPFLSVFPDFVLVFVFVCHHCRPFSGFFDLFWFRDPMLITCIAEIRLLWYRFFVGFVFS